MLTVNNNNNNMLEEGKRSGEKYTKRSGGGRKSKNFNQFKNKCNTEMSAGTFCCIVFSVYLDFQQDRWEQGFITEERFLFFVFFQQQDVITRRWGGGQAKPTCIFRNHVLHTSY